MQKISNSDIMTMRMKSYIWVLGGGGGGVLGGEEGARHFLGSGPLMACVQSAYYNLCSIIQFVHRLGPSFLSKF